MIESPFPTEEEFELWRAAREQGKLSEPEIKLLALVEHQETEIEALKYFWGKFVEYQCDRDGWAEIDPEIAWDDAVEAGLAEHVPYNPDEHGTEGLEETEPGDLIYLLTDLGMHLSRP